MQDREVTQDHKEFRGFKVFVVILGRKVIRDVKVQKEILVHKDQSAQRARLDQLAHKEISDFRVQEVFQVQREQQVQLDQWDHKV